MTQWEGTILDGKYELKKLLGEGGMGAVYEAQHKLIGRRLAVKFLHPQYAKNHEVVTRFEREATAAAQIGHENIIEVTDMGTAADGSPYIVMEFLEGCDVKKIIERDGIIDIKRTAHIMVQALSALEAAHRVGIIHRDLKPENIYLTDKSGKPDYVKLLDFGISKFKDLETDGAKALTQTGTVLGTPHYMSPEQARGEQDLTLRSDVYAMGVILYQMLTGCLPFDAPNYNALLIKILTEDPPLPEVLNPELPPDLCEVVSIAMNRDANLRFQNCAEFRARLLPYAPGATGTGMILTSATQTQIRRSMYETKTPFEMTQSGIERKKSKVPLIAGIAAGILLAAGAGVFFAMKDRGNPGASMTAVQPAAAVATQTTPVNAAADKAAETAAAEKTVAQAAENASTITLKISASPPTAVITIDGAKVSNPYEGKFARNDANRNISISASGFEEKTEMVAFTKDMELSYELDKIQSSGSHRATSKKTSSGDVVKEKEESKPADASGKKPRRKIDYDDPWN